MLKLRSSGKSGDAPVIVLIHGWGMGTPVWQRLVPLLEPNYRVITVDLPGYGENVAVSAGSLSDVAAEVLVSVPDQSVWLGWSLGGLVALRAAAMRAEAISRLVLVASSPRFVQEESWPHAMPEKQLSLFAGGLIADVDSTLKRFVALQFYGQEGAREVSRALQKEVVGRPVDCAALELGLDILAREDERSTYGRLALPVQHVYGAMDKLVPIKVSDDLAKLNPDVEQIVFKGVGHAPFVSHPELFVERLGL